MALELLEAVTKRRRPNVQRVRCTGCEAVYCVAMWPNQIRKSGGCSSCGQKRRHGR